jgi:cob(I)alamin adenosyltransferase
MPRLTTLTTGKGDDGTTALGGGQRVPKESARVRAYGTVDELNSAIVVALAHGLSERLTGILPSIQNELFHLGADLSFVEADKKKASLPQVEERHLRSLEALIEDLNRVVGPLQNFILPGGSVGAANLHLARAICRRAEREVAALGREEPIGPFVLRYLNRLSDALFVMARYENRQHGVAEPLWDSRA